MEVLYARGWQGLLAALSWAVAPRTLQLPLTGHWMHLWAGTGVAFILVLWVMTARAPFDEYKWTLAAVPRRRAKLKRGAGNGRNRGTRKTPMDVWVSRAMKTYKVATAVYFLLAVFLAAHLLEPALAQGADTALVRGLSLTFAMCGPILIALVYLVLDDCDRFATLIFFTRRQVLAPPRSICELDSSGLKQLVTALMAMAMCATLAVTIATWVYRATLDTAHLIGFALLQIGLAALQFWLLHWYLINLFKGAKAEGSRAASRRRVRGTPPEPTIAPPSAEPAPRLSLGGTFLSGPGPPFDVA